MTSLDLDGLCRCIPRERGRYVININIGVIKEANSYFEYDKYRSPQHPHFIDYGKNFFSLDYIGHYLLPNIGAIVVENCETPDLRLQYTIN